MTAPDWIDGMVVTLMREGINKHRAREITVGFWEAYCKDDDKHKPLTNAEINTLIDSVDGLGIGRNVMHKVARAIEAAHGIKERCPNCNGPADNGHDRGVPPSPYYCTKCMEEINEPTAR